MSSIPVLEQGFEGPIIKFVGELHDDLICSSCLQSVLVENYSPRSIYGVGLRCKECGHVEVIGPLSRGEILPEKIINVDDRESLVVEKTIVIHETYVITCSHQIDKARRTSLPRPPLKRSGTKISIEFLDEIIRDLNSLTGGEFNKPVEVTRRAFERGNRRIKNNLLAWSIEIVREYLENNFVRDKRSFAVALAVVFNHSVIMKRWKDHALIDVIASDFCKHYYHTFIQMIAATWFNDNSSKVTINLPSGRDGIRSADLRFRLSAVNDLYMEVKVPEPLDWIRTELSIKRLIKIVEKCLRESRGQISRDCPGILVIGSAFMGQSIHKHLERAVEAVLIKKGGLYSGVAAITTVSLFSITSNYLGNLKTDFNTEFYVSTQINKNYFQENPVKLGVTRY